MVGGRRGGTQLTAQLVAIDFAEKITQSNNCNMSINEQGTTVQVKVYCRVRRTSGYRSE